MDTQLSWVLEVSVKPGQLEPFRSLMKEMVAWSGADLATLSYEWYVSDDSGTVLLYERFADSPATVEHLRGFMEQYAERFMASVEPTRLRVLGNPSDDARAALAGFNPTYLRPFGGFVR